MNSNTIWFQSTYSNNNTKELYRTVGEAQAFNGVEPIILFSKIGGGNTFYMKKDVFLQDFTYVGV